MGQVQRVSTQLYPSPVSLFSRTRTVGSEVETDRASVCQVPPLL